MKRRFTIMGFLLATMVVAGIVLNRSYSKSQVPVMPQAYADPKSCSQCHTSETAGYANSGMAHAFYKPQAKDTIDSPAKGREYYHAASRTYYRMTEQGGKYFQKRWLQGFDGKPDDVEELQIDYIMGSG